MADLSKATNSAFDYIDASSAEIQAIAEETMREVEKKILAGVEAGRTKRVILAEVTLYVRNQSRKMRSLIESSFDDVIKLTKNNMIEEFENKLTTAELSAMAENKLAVLDNITANDLKLQADLRSMLLQNLGQTITVVQAVQSLENLYPSYASNIGTIVNTSLIRMYKDAEWSVEGGLFEYFEYVGPLDSVTRPYCRDHVGKVYTKAEAEKIQAEIQTFYNCRHKLAGITEADYKKAS